MTGDQYRALVCITTCQRLAYLRRYLPHYAAFGRRDGRFSLLVSVDGTEEDTLEFCRKWRIPVVYSDKREGVGLAKNRVLKLFPDFDYYFFLEDDVELVDSTVLPLHVQLCKQSGIHHFSLFEQGGARKIIGTSTIGDHRVVHCLFGAASFNFFSGEGLRKVGGWHPAFAQYRRWGHTEHSYRFVQAGLAPAPFNVAEDLGRAFIWHVPPPVTKVSGVDSDADQIAVPEREILDQRLGYVPVQTLSPVHFNGIPLGAEAQLPDTLTGHDRYPLVHGREKRKSEADYDLWRFHTEAALPTRLTAIAASITKWPGNPAIRHGLKQAVRR